MKKILIVEDDVTLKTALTRYLQERGYQVIHAASGTEGLSVFEQSPPDVVVSDVVMPKMDGLKFCSQLRTRREGQLVPFIFLSGRGELDDRIKGHAMGADDYLVKPFHPEELVAKIEAQLERSRRVNAEIVRMLQQRPEPLEPVAPEPPPLPLTPSEEKVFREVIQGYTNKQIGERLFISPRTVQTHLSNILSKLALENRAQLIRFAYENGYWFASDTSSESA